MIHFIPYASMVFYKLINVISRRRKIYLKSNESGFLSRQADPALLPIQGNVSALPTSMRLQHIHHWSIRNCFCHNSWYNNDWECHHVITCLLFWPYSGIFFDEKSWSRWGSNPRPLAWEADVLTTRPPGLRFTFLHIRLCNFSWSSRLTATLDLCPIYFKLLLHVL